MLYKNLLNSNTILMTLLLLAAVFLTGALIVDTGPSGFRAGNAYAATAWTASGALQNSGDGTENPDAANEATNTAEIDDSTGVLAAQSNIQSIRKIHESVATNMASNDIHLAEAHGALVSQSNILEIKDIRRSSSDDAGARNAASNDADIDNESDNNEVVQENEQETRNVADGSSAENIAPNTVDINVNSDSNKVDQKNEQNVKNVA
ncbi:MAG: hypothetical protein ACRD4B_05030, partial [Acidobacteriota bacterium]